MRKQRLQLNVAITHFKKLPIPIVKTRKNKTTGRYEKVIVLEDEKELEQFYLDLKKFPISSNVLDVAFKALHNQMQHTCENLGLLK